MKIVNLSCHWPEKRANLPSLEQFELWLQIVFVFFGKKASIHIEFVDEETSAEINFDYRNKNKPTNILSFSNQNTAKRCTGELVLCHQVILEESHRQSKKTVNHYAHLTVHGALHLLGFDHETLPEQEQMERLEIQILKQLSITDPYREIT